MAQEILNLLSEDTFDSIMATRQQRLEAIKNKLADNSPYEYMTVDEYNEATHTAGKLYWVMGDDGKWGVYKGDDFVNGEGEDISFSVDPILDNNTPDKIAEAARRGIAKNIWSVGDKVGIDLNGTVGSLAINGKYYAFILGFDHNASIEGNNTIHFQFGKTSDGTKTIAFVDSQYLTQTIDNYFTMKTLNSNSGGWASSRMRTTLMPQFKAAMSSEWRDIISPCTKYSDNTGGGSDTASYVTSTTDDIFLLAEYEVRGARSNANSNEKNYQAQYDYYANGNSKIFYKYNDTSGACLWWLRSVHAASAYNFCSVYSGGSAYSSEAAFSLGFAPGFKVGGNAA